MFKQIEKIGSPLSEIKEYLLKSYDHSVLTRKTKNDTVETKNIILTLFFINTFESYVNNISNESMTDGLMRRFNLVYSEKDGRDFTDYSIYNENKIRDEVISEKMIDFSFLSNPINILHFRMNALNYIENTLKFIGIKNIKIFFRGRKIFIEHI